MGSNRGGHRTETINIALVIIGWLVFFLGVVSRCIREWNFSEPLAALVVGVLLSSAGFGILDLERLDPQVLEEAARLALAVGVMGVALKVPSSYIIKNWQSVAVMLGIVMPFMWLANSLLTYWLLDFSFLTALLLGAIMTPTDPVLAISIVSGQLAKDSLPERLRDFNLSGVRFKRRFSLPFRTVSYSLDDLQTGGGSEPIGIRYHFLGSGGCSDSRGCNRLYSRLPTENSTE